MRKLNRRTKLVLTVAAVAAVGVNAGVAVAYWRITGSGVGAVSAGTAIELRIQGRPDADEPLFPGASSDLTVTVTNDNDFPIMITGISAGRGAPVADEQHREAGCRNTGVVVSQNEYTVSWKVQRNTIGVFTLRDGVAMTNQSDTACQGAVFTIPILATGTSAVP